MPDRATVSRLRDAAERLSRPKSAVARGVTRDLRKPINSERERLRLLRAFDELVPRIPSRPKAADHRNPAGASRRPKEIGPQTEPVIVLDTSPPLAPRATSAVS